MIKGGYTSTTKQNYPGPFDTSDLVFSATTTSTPASQWYFHVHLYNAHDQPLVDAVVEVDIWYNIIFFDLPTNTSDN